MGRRGTRGGVSAGAFGQHTQRAAKAGYSQAQHQRAPLLVPLHGNPTRSPATVPVRPPGGEEGSTQLWRCEGSARGLGGRGRIKIGGDNQLNSDKKRIPLLSQAMCLERCCMLGPVCSDRTNKKPALCPEEKAT